MQERLNRFVYVIESTYHYIPIEFRMACNSMSSRKNKASMKRIVDPTNTGPLVGQCLTYLPLPHLGYGPAQSCVSILENCPDDILRKTLFLLTVRKPIAGSIDVRQGIPVLLRNLPYIPKFGASWLNQHISDLGVSSLDRLFRRAIDTSDPSSTVAYFWPDPSLSVVQHARNHGLITVREMINTFRGTAKVILDDAYDRLGLKSNLKITRESVEREREELALYDYVFASNAMVEASLLEAGVEAKRIIPSSFGWSPARFAARPNEPRRSENFRALFVGSVCVRKGVPQLLAAWKKSRVKGELILAGAVEDAIKPLLQHDGHSSPIHVLDHVTDVGSLYRSADVFVFPTLEEGGPQVTYEAAGCGLPVITTPMGAARLVKDGHNGLIVNSNDIDGLAEAIARLAASSELRHSFGRQAKIDAMNYTYQMVGYDRATKLNSLLQPED